jgi:peptidoglycan/xylan/chitin deacetylase (PgdA/CDA1 family)
MQSRQYGNVPVPRSAPPTQPRVFAPPPGGSRQKGAPPNGGPPNGGPPREIPTGGDAPDQTRKVPPRPRFLFVGFLLLVLVSVLMVQAYVQAQIATPRNIHLGGPSDTVPDSVTTGGPIIDTTRSDPVSYRLRAKDYALTFDDGPDPKWTPIVLALLRKYHVHATFFLVGAHVTEYPELVKQMVADGNEVGIHSFTHPEMSSMAKWERKLQYSQTQMAIVGAAGVTTSLLRFPYSSEPDAIDDVYWPIVEEAGQLGYLNVVNDTDSEDWSKPGVANILKLSRPEFPTRGTVALFHDAGGDRHQTVEALDQLIRKYKSDGYNFVTVGEGLKRAPKWDKTSTYQVQNPATSGEIWRGRAMIWVVQASGWFVTGLVGLLAIVGVLTLGRLILMLVLATVHVRRRRRKDFRWGPEFLEPVSVVVPAYNEKEGIAAAVRSLATSNYPMVEVIVVDDGSSDNTAEIAEGLGFANVRVVRVPNGGKPAALNVGTAWARADIIVMVDGGPAGRRPAGRRGGRQREGRQPAEHRRALAAHRVRHRVQPRQADVRHPAVHADDPRGDRRVPPRSPQGRGWRIARDPRRRHRPDDRDGSGRLAGRLRGEGPGLDRGALDDPAALETAVPVELRHHAGDVEAPPRDCRVRSVGSVRPVRPALPGDLPGRLAALRALDRRLRAVRVDRVRCRTLRGGLGRDAGVAVLPGGLRVQARQGKARPALGAPGTAVRLPAIDVRGDDPVGGHRAHRSPAALAQAPPHGPHHAGRLRLVEGVKGPARRNPGGPFVMKREASKL